MFSTEETLKKRTGKNPIDRFKFLELLVNEFKTTESKAAKSQVLANLANFAYDPINYGFIRQLQVINLFLDELAEVNGNNVEFAIAGICNLCLDKENKDYILSCGGVRIVASCLSSSSEEIVISAITTLIFLVTPKSKADITSSEIVQYMLYFSVSPNPRLKNLANIFLMDYCTLEQIEEAKNRLDANV